MTVLEMPLPCGRVTLINEEHWSIAEPYKWHAKASNKTAQAYNAAAKELFGEFALLNAYRPPNAFQLDAHTLRVRKRKNNTSGYRGVSWSWLTQKWRASIQNKWLGEFETSWEAAQAFNVAARDVWGDAAFQNARHPDPPEPPRRIVSLPHRLTESCESALGTSERCACGAELTARLPGAGRPRKFCSTKCRMRAANAAFYRRRAAAGNEHQDQEVSS